MGMLLAALLTACGRDVSPPSSAAATNQQIFKVKGTIKELLPGGHKAVIAHETITNYMDAMTMEFDVKDARELAGLATNDLVSFRMIVTDKDGWIDQVKKIGVNTNAPASGPAEMRRVREVEPLNVGDLMPPYHFTNEFGQPFSLADFQGRALAFTFIFTRCPYPTFCPRLSSNFSDAQNALKARAGGPTNWHFLSITIDPEFDTPANLAAYAQKLTYDTNRWTFATGELIDITAIGEQFGLYFWKESGTISHNVRTIVLDTKGRVHWTTKENDWKPAVLVEEIVKAAAVK